MEELCKFRLLRREPIIAIGGGVVLDIAGFVANMYRRGKYATVYIEERGDGKGVPKYLVTR